MPWAPLIFLPNSSDASVMTFLPVVPSEPPQTVFRTLPRFNSLSYFKSRFRKTLRPITSRLARTGVTANQVTIASLVGSLLIGELLCVFANFPALFTILPVWLLVRMACATIDGTLAVESGQKSRLGGILNEAGDIISETGLFLPLAFLAAFSKVAITFLIFLAAVSELGGIGRANLGEQSSTRRSPWQSDRSTVLALIGLPIATLGRLRERAFIVVPILATALLNTIWNRVRFAFADPCGSVSQK
jgi:CDP-diacylglycerol--glycerol-3-phosphate 3-phosphatidyltransferase